MNFLWKSLKQMVVGSDLEILDRAIDRVAHIKADAERHRIKVEYYTTLLFAVNPHTEWWTFATMKDKQLENQQEYDHESIRADRALERLAVILEQIGKTP